MKNFKILKDLVFFVWLLLLFGASSCEKGAKKKEEINYLDFEQLMGKSTDLWQYIQDSCDHNNLLRFKTLFLKQAPYLGKKKSTDSIPKTLHLIWLGPRSFPQTSIKNVYSWVERNPNWQVKFWTDRPRELPHPGLELCLVEDFSFANLEKCYKESTNFGEKSDILRYEILLKEGGVYVDHDVECFKSFDSLLDSFDFFCGIEPPHPPVVNGSVTVCNNLIASIPNHPILQKSIHLVKNRWEAGKKMFEGNDAEMTIQRVAYRTFAAFDLAVKELAGEENRKDIVFPAGYFNRLEKKYGLFAHHYYDTTWFENETKFEKAIRRRIEYIAKKNNQILGLIGILTVLNFTALGFVVFLCRRK
ncbi:MAG: hypothetical protein Tsb0015_10430 [Simkaniaceae bacterium]